MAFESPKPWPEPPEPIQKNWPDGFPEDGSEAFRVFVYKKALRVMSYIARQIEVELSTSDRLLVRRLTEKTIRQYFSGDYHLDIYSSVYYQFCLERFGYTGMEITRKIYDIFRGETETVVRTLLHRVHDRDNHE
jgi:CRISPR/Cas system-associated protein Cas5 (RAMP superfamily)